jgi:hypothetical protein
MPHPYQQYESTELWQAIDAEISELEANRDLQLSTARHYVIGSLCKRLVEAGLATARRGDAPAV